MAIAVDSRLLTEQCELVVVSGVCGEQSKVLFEVDAVEGV